MPESERCWKAFGGHADEENADRQVPGISWPHGAAAAAVAAALSSSRGEEEMALEPAWVPGLITSTLGCLYNHGHHEDCQGRAGSRAIQVLLNDVSSVPEQRHQKYDQPGRIPELLQQHFTPGDLLMLQHQGGAPLPAPTCQPTRKSPRPCYSRQHFQHRLLSRPAPQGLRRP